MNTKTVNPDTLILDGHEVFIPPGKTEAQVRSALEKARNDPDFLIELIGLYNAQRPQVTAPPLAPPAPPPAVAPLQKQVVRPGIEANLLLFQVFLNAFEVKDWSELKGRYQRDDAGNVVRHLLGNSLVGEEELGEVIEAVDAYAIRIQAASPTFAYTDYQFFAVLFSELFFRHRQQIRDRAAGLALSFPNLRLYEGAPPKGDALKGWLIDQLRRVGQNVVKRGGEFTAKYQQVFERLEAGLAAGHPVDVLLAQDRDLALVSVDAYLARLNRLACYMATGSGKTHLLHVHLMQAERHLPSLLGWPAGQPLNFYVVVPTTELAKQHERELRRYFPSKGIVRVEDEGDKTVTESVVRVLTQTDANIRILTTHQLAAAMQQYREERSAANPFGEANVVFADEGHKGVDKDAGWRADRDRLTGENGFCFEYSATFSQSIRDNTALLQEYGKAIIFDYPYRRFYQDGYGKKPNFFPEERAGNIARAILAGKGSQEDERQLTEHDRWTLFIQQLERFHEQVREYQARSGDREYLSRRFDAPLMLMMCQRVDEGREAPSHIKQVITLVRRFLANVGNESVAELGGDEARFQAILRDIFHVAHPQNEAILLLHRLNDGELGLRVAGSPYFGVVYVGSVAAIGVELENDQLQESLMAPFFAHGDNPIINVVIAARRLIEGWDTHRISSLGLVELGKAKGSLVVQLFGRGVRLRGTPQNRLKRDGLFPVSERFDVFGYEAAYLQTFIQEAEAADAVEEHTLEVRIELKEGEPKNRRVPVAWKRLAEADSVTHLTPDKRFHEIARRLRQLDAATRNPVEFDAWPLLNHALLYQEVQIALQIPNLVMARSAFDQCARVVLSPCRLPLGSSVSDVAFLQRWAKAQVVRAILGWHRALEHEYEFAHADLREVTPENSRSLNFGTYKISGPVEKIRRIEQELIENGTVRTGAYIHPGPTHTPVALYDHEVLAVRPEPHLFDPLLVRLSKHEDLRISPDRLEESELRLVRAMHAYAQENGDVDFTLLRNQKEWGFLGFYPDFVLWLKAGEVEHIAFLDPKGLTLHNTTDVADKLMFSLALAGLEEKVRATAPNVRLSSFLLLNHDLKHYVDNEQQRDLLNATLGRVLQERLLGSEAPEPVQFKNQELLDLLRALNARPLSGAVGELLDAIRQDDKAVRREAIKVALRQALPEQVKEELKTFWEDVGLAASQNRLTAFVKERGLSRCLESPQLAYLGYSVRRLFGEEQYTAFVQEVEREDNKRIQKEATELARDTLLDVVLDAASVVVPGARIGMRVGKLVLRKLQEKRDQQVGQEDDDGQRHQEQARR